ncbi:fumarylacetoacetate hydrolase family protein [Sulfitobacter aestuariivivens]|uniref:Fumarylacetoacetate hydrolase family protein n=1 Tax=Sulfitobacter aestuariivivens TaxID=2766981 RepID=A0A927D7G1_9RHOB|nr:fumarylacetoacetate hydrolase family protein [Sulfitobacter aestuariivivens]MBD3664952.1 fumarylacetoacetate hydrolase family protein [Sulfitobacter aestuariivivens]
MKLVTYRDGVEGEARLGVVQDDLVIDTAELGQSFGEAMPDSMLGLIDAGRPGLAALRALLDQIGNVPPIHTATALSSVTLLAPIPKLRKNIFGIGLNYTDHVTESARALDTDDSLPKQPVIFSKPPTAVIGPGEPIEHNAKITQQMDWEVELAVVLGSTASRVSRAEALRYVFGYSVMIDVSARDNRRAGQWIYSKGQDTYAPFGPCIVTADEITDPQTLELWLTVNGVEKQRDTTAKMLFKVDELIADISQGITLEPGDVIATGTPAGVGAGRDPQEWMWPGDTVVACVEGIGTLRHPIIDATPD